MDEKKPPEKKLLIDRLQVSNVHMGFNPPNPEKVFEQEERVAALKEELGISKPLLYAPDFNVEVLLRAKELLYADWENSVSLWKGRLFDQMTDHRKRAITAAAVTLIGDRLCRTGAKLRRNGDFAGAELVYRTLNQYCSEMQEICIARIRLAEMIRKKEIPAENPAAELAQLLRIPIEQGNGEAIMTLVLFLAGRNWSEVSQKQWLEDIRACIEIIEPECIQDVAMYWEACARLGDPEGDLVHLLLLMFEKLDESPLGSREELLDTVKEKLPEIGRRFLTFVVENEAGQPVECEVLFTLESVDAEAVYLVYTDNTEDEEGNTKVYANIFDGRNLLPVETESEWQMIEAHLEQLRAEFGAGED
ncbi:MAG: DUF1292 domain-containing protein [Lentisphaeria bacterium]|nr:DUF1292 domain-containing protein [Lentisphaeria bacterium]